MDKGARLRHARARTRVYKRVPNLAQTCAAAARRRGTGAGNGRPGR